MKKLATIGVAAIIVVAVLTTLTLRPQPVEVPTVPAPPSIVSDPGEDLQSRTEWNLMRLADPSTGEIPADIRRRELEFAKSIPTAESFGKTNLATWSARGPRNVGGRTRGLAVDIDNENIIIAGGVSGGIWRSTNGGATWTKQTGASQLHSITTIVQDPVAGRRNNWYAGTGEIEGNSASGNGSDGFFLGDGIYHSSDSGVTWALLASTVSGTPEAFEFITDVINKIAIDPTRSDSVIMYAAVFGAILRSNDGFSTFSSKIVLGGAPFASSNTDVMVTSTGVVYGALRSSSTVNKGVWMSTTGFPGSFTDITPGVIAALPPSLDWRRIELAQSPSNAQRVWAIFETPGSGTNGHQLWRYNAASNSWADFSVALPLRGTLTQDIDSQGGYDLVIKVHPTDTNAVFVGAVNLWRIDMGDSSNYHIGGYEPSGGSYGPYPNSSCLLNVPSTCHHPDQHALVFLSDPNQLLSGSDGGIKKTSNSLAVGDGAVTWTDISTTYITSQFYTFCMNSNASDPIIAGGTQDNGTWSTTSNPSIGVNWSEEWSGDGAFCSIYNPVPTHQIRFITAQLNNFTRKRYVNGSFVAWDSGILPTDAGGQLFIHPFAHDPADEESMFYPGTDVVGPAQITVWRTNNADSVDSASWTNLEFGLGTVDNSITALAVSNASPAHTLYFGTSAGEVFKVASANTASAPVTPTDIFTGKGMPTSYVSDIAIDPNDGNKVLIVFSNYNTTSLYYTVDGGGTWTDVENNLAGASGPSVRSAAITNTASPFVVGTSIGVYSATTLPVGTWVQEGASLIGNVVVDMVRYRSADGLLVAATHGTGIYSTPLTPLAVELVAFDAVVAEDGVHFAWQTVSETGNAGFEIEYRSGDDADFATLDFVSGSGDSNESRTYSHVAELAPGRYTFRLKSIDVNGSFQYSDEIETIVEIPGTHLLTDAYPNPFGDRAQFTVTLREEQSVRVELFNAIGQLVRVLHDGPMSPTDGHRFEIDGSNLASGLYHYRVTGENFNEAKSLTLVK